MKGFTLLEVMIAVAILGLSLTSIFASEVGAAKVASRSRKTSTASLLARCKMGEIEELVATEGFPAIEKKGTDGCCEDSEVEGFECDWSIVRIVLPDFGSGTDEEDDDGDPLGLGSGAPSTQEVLSGGGGDLSGLAMQLAYPALKPAIENQVRRATVNVKWSEGSREHGFDVVQFLVDEPGPALPEEDDEESEDES